MGERSDSLTTFHTWGVEEYWGGGKKLQTFSTSHSESHPNKLSKWTLQLFHNSKKKKKSRHPCFSFLNRRWMTVEDVIAVVSHNIQFNWQKTREEKIKVEWTGWTNVHAQPFRCHWWQVFLYSFAGTKQTKFINKKRMSLLIYCRIWMRTSVQTNQMNINLNACLHMASLKRWNFFSNFFLFSLASLWSD